MKQQVNLYQAVFQRHKIPFSARALARGALVMAVGLLALAGQASWQLHRQEAQMDVLRAQAQASAARLAEVQERLAKRRADAALDRAVARLERTLWQRRQLLTELTAPVAANTTGFSPFLTAIARHSPPGLWLQAITLNAGGAAVDLHGRALDSTALPRYLQRLGQEAEFAGKAFSSLEITRPQSDPAPIEFRLRGAGEET